MATRVELLTGLVNVAIPEVYQKGMSYYEVLTAVVNKVNELIEQSNEYFSEDVQTIMTSILNRWKDDGTLGTLIADAVLNIGDRQYTEQNFVTNGETVTASLDALDTTVASHLADNAKRGVSPKKFGAHSTDEIGYENFDSTTAFNTAIHTVSQTNGILLIDGTYRIGSVSVLSGVTILGVEGNLLIRNTIDTSTLDIPITESNILISGVNFDGNVDEFPNYNYQMNAEIKANGKNVLIEKCSFINLQGSAVTSAYGNNITFKDSIVYDFSDHVFYMSTSAKFGFAENIVSYNDKSNRSAYKTRNGVEGFTVKNCRHYKTVEYGGCGRFLEVYAEARGNLNILIENCYADTNFNPILCGNTEDGAINEGITIKDSTFKNVRDTSYSSVTLNWNNRDVLVTKNVVIDNVTLENYMNVIGFKNVENVTFSKCTVVTHPTLTNYSIAIYDCTNVTVKDNDITDNYGVKINFYGAPNGVLIENNRFSGSYHTFISLRSAALSSGKVFVQNNFVTCTSRILTSEEPVGTKNGIMILDGNSLDYVNSDTLTGWYDNVIFLENLMNGKLRYRSPIVGGSYRTPFPMKYETYFDVTLNQPIWWNGTDWVDATGTVV